MCVELNSLLSLDIVLPANPPANGSKSPRPTLKGSAYSGIPPGSLELLGLDGPGTYCLVSDSSLRLGPERYQNFHK